jgi:hypothetical protein
MLDMPPLPTSSSCSSSALSWLWDILAAEETANVSTHVEESGVLVIEGGTLV